MMSWEEHSRIWRMRSTPLLQHKRILKINWSISSYNLLLISLKLWQMHLWYWLGMDYLQIMLKDLRLKLKIHHSVEKEALWLITLSANNLSSRISQRHLVAINVIFWQNSCICSLAMEKIVSKSVSIYLQNLSFLLWVIGKKKEVNLFSQC